MIQFQEVSQQYPGGQPGLQSINLTIADGEMVFVTGHSGAGKSTLLKLIAHQEACHQGKLTVNGFKLHRMRRRQIPKLRSSMGIVFQDPQLLPDYTVYENVALPLVVRGLREPEVGRRVRAALAKVGLLTKETAFPQAISTGEQQRVGIARAIVHKPDLIIADEPTGNLDPKLSTEIMGLFAEFNQVGVTVIIASHDLALIASLPYRIITIDHGQLL